MHLEDKGAWHAALSEQVNKLLGRQMVGEAAWNLIDG